MTNRERTGTRDLTISAWHRRNFDDDQSAFDLDLIGVCKLCGNPLYVWETTRAADKNTTWTGRSAHRFNVPGYLVTYWHDPDGSLDMTVAQIYPAKRRIGGQIDLKYHIDQLRTAHRSIWHGSEITR